MSAGGMPAGSSRALRLDPMALPVRYKANDAGADERERYVELDRDRVVVRRAVRGIRMQVSTPVAEFLGVAIRIVPPAADFDGAVEVTLEHRDPGLSVPLFVAADGRDVTTEWQTWSRVLDLPRLVADTDGELRDPFASGGGLRIGEPAPRRVRRTALRSRRGRSRFRRKLPPKRELRVYRGEREIIARN